MCPKAERDLQAVISLQESASARDGKDSGLSLRFSKCPDELEAIAIRHHDIGDYQIKTLLPQAARGVLRIRNRYHRMSAALEPGTEQVANTFFIVSD